MGFNALPDETLEDLQLNGLYLLQKKDAFRFGMDAVLLSNFVSAKRGQRVLDLGTGTGIIPVLLSAKTWASQIIGLEIQADIADMARRSVEGNNLYDRVIILKGDIKEVNAQLQPCSFDVVVSNPPYTRVGQGLVNPEETKAVARHEVLCTLEDVLDAANFVLKPNGSLLSLIHIS
ncbi:MAG: methyltransferase, partial [Clostridia bacterium]|nr:methyltransferase [Clostridia bacterium]